MDGVDGFFVSSIIFFYDITQLEEVDSVVLSHHHPRVRGKGGKGGDVT